MSSTTPPPYSLDFKVLLHFMLDRGIAVKAGVLAKRLGVKHSTMNSVLERLKQEGLVSWEKYGDVRLDEGGRALLDHVETHHHLIEVFLVDSLGLSPGHAREEAYRLAMHFSCDTIKKICDKYGRPDSCPNGKAIPHAPGCHTHEEDGGLRYIAKEH